MAKQSRAVDHARRAIAAQAARLIAEDGLADFGAAKRKAARQLGFRDGDGLPDNAEIEQALRAYQNLFQNDEQRSRLLDLRVTALAMMRNLEAHHPYLAGAVWKGTATRGAGIDIDLFTDDQKPLELSLINRGIAYATAERAHFGRPPPARVPVLTFEHEGVDIRLAVHFLADERNALKADSTGQPERGNSADVAALIAAEEEQDRVERFLAAIR